MYPDLAVRKLVANALIHQDFLVGIEERNGAVSSRIIADAMQAGWVKPFDPGRGRKYAKYIPGWA